MKKPRESAKSAQPVDRYVGSRIRARRNARKVSQTELGDALGITFQQVQKYEKGVNRIGASRLWEIATVLEVPVEWFFEGLAKESGRPIKKLDEDAARMVGFLSDRHAPHLVDAYVKLKPKARLTLVRLLSLITAGR